MTFHSDIAAVIILGDRLTYISNCIKSIINHVDAVVVVLNGEHKTPQYLIESLQNKYNTPIYTLRCKWHNDYSEQLNYGIERCQNYGWIIRIDDDERAIINCNLKNLVKNAKPDIGGYRIQIICPHQYMNYFAVQTHFSTRIFASHYRYRYKVHEDIAEDIINSNRKIETLSSDHLYCYHLGYDSDINTIIKKANERIKQCEEMLECDDNKCLWHYYLAKHYAVIEQTNKAIYHCVQSLSYPISKEKQKELLDLLTTLRRFNENTSIRNASIEQRG